MKNSRCIEAVARDNAVIAGAGRIPYFPLVVGRARGAVIEDIGGNKYIDLLSSGGALNVGHSHPAVNKAIIEQVNKYLHYTPAYSYNEPMIELAEKLVEITPGSFKKQVAFGLTGSDANDGTIKFARSYTGRSKIITFIGAYHGATYGSMTMTAISSRMRRKIGPFLSDIYSFNYPNCYRCSYCKNRDACSLECLEDLKIAFKSYIPADEVAAIIIEPVQGDGGIIVPPVKYIRRLHEICAENGILFISEEVQQGFGRTGKWFGIEHYDVAPDIIVMGKSIAAGMPLSAIVAREEIIQSLESPAHAFTMAGNPVCCSAALSMIEIMSEEGFMEHVAEIGNLTVGYFYEMQQKYEIIGDVRGLGLSIGVELVKDRATKEKDSDAAAKICYRSYEKGVIMIYLNGNVLRIQPPLIIGREEMLKALEIIDSAINDYVSGKIPDEVLKLSNGWK